MHCSGNRVGTPMFLTLSLVVAAFMVLSLLVTATGTARFAVAMGYDAKAGYAVGTIFDIAKGILPVALLALWPSVRSVAVLLGVAWVCLVTFSCLATHATVSTAISSIERTGTWKMEVRGNTKAELISVEQQLAALSRPARPSREDGARGAGVHRVPSGVWKDSQECKAIRSCPSRRIQAAQTGEVTKQAVNAVRRQPTKPMRPKTKRDACTQQASRTLRPAP